MNDSIDNGLVFFYGMGDDVYCTLFLRCRENEEILRFFSTSPKFERFSKSATVDRLGIIFYAKSEEPFETVNRQVFKKTGLDPNLLKYPVTAVAFDQVNGTFGIFMKYIYHECIPAVQPYESFQYDDGEYLCFPAQLPLEWSYPSVLFHDFDTLLFLYSIISHEGIFVHDVSEFISEIYLDLYLWYIDLREEKLEKLEKNISFIDNRNCYSEHVLKKIEASITSLKDRLNKLKEKQDVDRQDAENSLKSFDSELKSCYDLLREWNMFNSNQKIDVDYITYFNEESPFYRGVSRPYFNEIPKALRCGSDYDESGRYSDFLCRFPDHYANKSFIESLMDMQHYELPTRLLDITSSPLVALYMACSDQYTKPEDNKYPAEVIIYFPQHEEIRHARDMDIEVLSTVIMLDQKDKNDLSRFLCTGNFQRNDRAVGYCNHYFFQTDDMTPPKEKPIGMTMKDADLIYCKQILMRFQNKVKLKFPGYSFRDFNAWDLFKSYYLVGEDINERIRAQAGSFILFGLNERAVKGFESSKNGFAKRIFIENKDAILSELSMLNISRKTLTPDLVNVARDISRH